MCRSVLAAENDLADEQQQRNDHAAYRYELGVLLIRMLRHVIGPLQTKQRSIDRQEDNQDYITGRPRQGLGREKSASSKTVAPAKSVATSGVRVCPLTREQVDRSRIVVTGHSMGGFDTVMVGDDAGVAGFVTISAADIGDSLAQLNTLEAREAARSEWAEDISFTNMS